MNLIKLLFQLWGLATAGGKERNLMEAESLPKKLVGEEKNYCNQKPLKSEPDSVELEPTQKHRNSTILYVYPNLSAVLHRRSCSF